MNPFRSLIGLVIGSALVVLLATSPILVWRYDHAFEGFNATIGPKLPFLPCCQLKLVIPPGVGPADAQALAEADLRTRAAQAAQMSLQAALSAQNSQLDALSLAGRHAQADLSSAAKEMRQQMLSDERSEAAIIAAGSGPGDICTRAKAVDDQFLGDLP